MRYPSNPPTICAYLDFISPPVISVSNAGSFIRPSASIQYGQSFLQALRSKYIEARHGGTSQETVLLGSSKGAIIVEAVNLDKVRSKLSNLENLREASLNGENVARSDHPGEIRQCCPSLCASRGSPYLSDLKTRASWSRSLFESYTILGRGSRDLRGIATT